MLTLASKTGEDCPGASTGRFMDVFRQMAGGGEREKWPKERNYHQESFRYGLDVGT